MNLTVISCLLKISFMDVGKEMRLPLQRGWLEGGCHWLAPAWPCTQPQTQWERACRGLSLPLRVPSVRDQSPSPTGGEEPGRTLTDAGEPGPGAGPTPQPLLAWALPWSCWKTRPHQRPWSPVDTVQSGSCHNAVCPGRPSNHRAHSPVGGIREKAQQF